MATEATDSTPRDVSLEKETARTASPPMPVGRKLPKKVLRKKIFTTFRRGA
jgi:hypothetical protein